MGCAQKRRQWPDSFDMVLCEGEMKGVGLEDWNGKERKTRDNRPSLRPDKSIKVVRQSQSHPRGLTTGVSNLEPARHAANLTKSLRKGLGRRDTRDALPTDHGEPHLRVSLWDISGSGSGRYYVMLPAEKPQPGALRAGARDVASLAFPRGACAEHRVVWHVCDGVCWR